MSLFYQPGIKSGIHHLSEEESRHCSKVLRCRTGDMIDITDGTGTWYKGRITQADPRKCQFTILESQETAVNDFYIHIMVAPTKNMDRMEWFMEKAVEIGIDEVSFIQCHQSERKILKTDRLHRKAISAMKQSLKHRLPKINPLAPLTALLQEPIKEQEKYIAYVDHDNPDLLFGAAAPKQSYCILIGPEGDFSKEELKTALNKGFQKISLGESRLRTETAALAACHILNLING